MLVKDEFYMQEALKEAQRAFDEEEVPIGAVIVHQGRLVARAYNQTRRLKDPTAHAEMIAITQAANALQDERLAACRLYVTIEPCTMCAGAMVWSRIARLIYGAADPKAGACGSVLNVPANERLNHHVEVTAGVAVDAAGALMTDFFERLRRQGKS